VRFSIDAWHCSLRRRREASVTAGGRSGAYPETEIDEAHAAAERLAEERG
jgi:hypothetical protein